MSYDEFLIRIRALGMTVETFACRVDFTPRWVTYWRRGGVPKWVPVLITAWQTIEFQRAALHEFNLRSNELAAHSGELDYQDEPKQWKDQTQCP